MARVLVGWIGQTDLRAVAESAAVGLGPVASALSGRRFDHAVLLLSYRGQEAERYAGWLKRRTPVPIRVIEVELPSPMDFAAVYAAAVKGCETAIGLVQDAVELTFHLSPGTPVMAAVWMILAKSRFPARLIASSQKHGVEDVAFPFDLAAEFIPEVGRRQSERLGREAEAHPPSEAGFGEIIYRSPAMQRVVGLARRIAESCVPVLIEGESGTGKELFGRAIHSASGRHAGHLRTINCGAIAPNLIESELFGHVRGAFTGADRDRVGWFEAADGGTLVLDEVGELECVNTFV